MRFGILILVVLMALGTLREGNAQVTPWETHMTAGMRAYQEGHYDDAERSFVAAVTAAEGFGLDTPLLATSLDSLAAVYQAQGRYGEAELLHRRALAIEEKTWGADHPNVARSLNNLAVLYQAQGRYGEAELLYKRALAIEEKALGPDNPDLATGLENYAGLLRKTNREAEAATMEARAEAIRAKHRKQDLPK